jgi:putative endopeptidase
MNRAAYLALAFFLAACATAPKPPATPAPPPPRPLLGQHGFELGSIDRSVGACQDFYQYAVGGWRTAHPLPAIYSRYGRFEEVDRKSVV